MNFCKKCGNKLVNGSCPNCSTAYNSNTNKKKSKFIMVLILIALIIVGALFIYGKSVSKTQPEIAAEFSNAISTQNSDKLQQILYCDNQNLQINKTNANVLIDYLIKNPSVFSKINDDFKSGNYTTDNYPLSIKEVSKSFLFFPVYKVVVKPTFINVKSNFKNYKVKILDKTYDNLNETSEIGPLMPGNYNIMAELSNSYLHKSEVTDISTFDDNCPEINIFEDLKTIDIDSDIPDADLYVNNKNTGIKVKDAKNFGPLEENSVIYAVANEGGKKIISNGYVSYLRDRYDIKTTTP